MKEKKEIKIRWKITEIIYKKEEQEEEMKSYMKKGAE